MARIAQAFTTTLPTVTLPPEAIKSIPDIKFQESNFTDGVGTISPDLASEIDELLLAKLSVHDRKRRVTPTCYQVRVGGAKGMLSLDPLLQGRCICIRPSMEKFVSPAGAGIALDIAESFTRPLPAFLNRPLIKILEDLGIAPQSFQKLQDTAVTDVEKARLSCSGGARLLDQTGLAAAARLPETLRRFVRILQLDFQTSHSSDTFRDPFLERVLQLACVQAMKGMKYFARIPLPGCWNLVGIADEDRYLKEGEIYACIKRAGERTIYLEGDVCISRSPTVHPGDVRVVRAIGRLAPGVAPRLAAQVNCVAFSVKGYRSLPSMLGGGDLDGDLYMLITDPNLIPKRTQISAPGEYKALEMVRLNRDCTIEDGAKFALQYILNDLMGAVATRHLLIADQDVLGTFSPPCLALAELHSHAVDFAKTGRAVDHTSLPRAASPLKPDFMCPEWQGAAVDEKYYQSKKILGQLFRSVPLDTSTPDKVHNPSQNSLDDGRYLTTSLKFLPIDGIEDGILGEPDRELVYDFRQYWIPDFGEDLLRRARGNTLSRRVGSHLREEEVFVGTIAAPSKDNKAKREMTIKLQEQTKELFSSIRKGISGEDGAPLEDQARRAWAAWHAALETDQQVYGVKSFAWLSMGLLMSCVAELNGEK